VNLDQLRPVIEAPWARCARRSRGSREDCRAAFRALLCDRKMRVFPDEERRFRVEGMLELALETADARAGEPRASAFTGSGGALRPGAVASQRARVALAA